MKINLTVHSLRRQILIIAIDRATGTGLQEQSKLASFLKGMRTTEKDAGKRLCGSKSYWGLTWEGTCVTPSTEHYELLPSSLSSTFSEISLIHGARK